MIYLGRIVGAGVTRSGIFCIGYRVSSRSFPNREAKIFDKAISIIPKSGYEGDILKNPYIAYNCFRISNEWAVASNGTHTDPIFEKILSGMSPRDAVAVSLLALDYEKDSYNTPRICTVGNGKTKKIVLGIIRKDSLQVQELELSEGNFIYVSTYEHNNISKEQIDSNFDVKSADELCEYMLSKGVFANFANPVTAVSAMFDGKEYKSAVKNL